MHDDPPNVFIADDLETLNWVLALKLIARTPADEIPERLLEPLREAIRSEHWGLAVSLWMEVRPGKIDVYPSHELYRPSDVDLAAEEMQFTPLFIQ